MGTQSKRKKGTKDNRSITGDLKREAEQDANRTALLPTFDSIAYSPVGISQTDHVEISDSIDPLQTNAPTIPAQITGLNVVTGINNNTLNLTWTISGSLGVTEYNIYRSVSSGAEVLIDTSPTNSYSDTSLLGATTYYYKVAAVNSAGIGTLSTEDSATTTGTVPAQITGLNVTVIGNNQLNLTWNASTNPTLINYNIYRNIATGTEVLIDTSATNSYSDITVNAGTTYYYKVAAVNDVGVGVLSVENSATTTGTPPAITPDYLFSFNNNILDSSANGMLIGMSAGLANPYVAGQFSTAVSINTPALGTYRNGMYLLGPAPTYSSTDPHVVMDTSIGFSFSCWIKPTDITLLTTGHRRVIIHSAIDANNWWSLLEDSNGKLYFMVSKAGTLYKREITLTLNSWQHIAAVFNGTTNTVELYKNAVAGSSSTASVTDISLSGHTNFFVSIAYGGAEDDTYYEGIADEFQYFKSRVLTSTQVTNLMNTNAP